MQPHRPCPTRASRRRYLSGLASALGAGALAGCSEAAEEPPAGDGSASGTSTVTARTGSATGTGDGATSTGTRVHAGYETTEVTARSSGGEVLGAVTAAVADTPDLRYLGLSDTASLPEDRGMLFVYDEVGDRTFVMRDMDFGLDIVYADADGVVTTVHHARAPGPDEDGEDLRYPGRGQYVLEVNRGWTTERGVEAGARLEFEL